MSSFLACRYEDGPRSSFSVACLIHSIESARPGVGLFKIRSTVCLREGLLMVFQGGQGMMNDRAFEMKKMAAGSFKVGNARE
jgi:hypothetical protein